MAMVVENQQPVAQLVEPAAQPSPPPPPPPPPPPLPQAYKHHCKVCKKGFMCGPALGGHMRAHGVADDDGLGSTDEEVTFDEDDAGPCGGSGTGDDSTEAVSNNNKRMYALRANPGRLKSCRVCENCGKEFTSWKSLLGHGKFNDDEDEDDDMNGMRRSPPLLQDGEDDGGDEEMEADLALAAAGWPKGKRTRCGKVIMGVGNGSVTEETVSHSCEEEDLANCLVMLSSSSRSVLQQPPPAVLDADQDSCAPASKDDAEIRNRFPIEPQPISMLAPNQMVPELNLLVPPRVVVSVSQQPVSTVPRGMFECKACKKVFTSHQALGGHRASHKKVKGCYAAKLDSDTRITEPSQPVASAVPSEITKTNASEHPMNSGSSSAVVMATAAPETAFVHADGTPAPTAAAPPVNKKKGKVHECSICHRVFTSGQALGGHKRCHWLTTGSGDPTTAAKLHHPIVTQDHVIHAVCQQLTLGRPTMFDAAAAHPAILDLNLTTNTAAAEVAAAKAKQATELNGSVLCLNAPASLYTATSSRNDAAGAAAATEDEADSRNTKKAKIGDLKGMNVAGETSPWLQVGIGLPSESKEKSIQE